MSYRLVLRSGPSFIICDEYSPNDGRVHVWPDHRYGMFYADTMTLELRKVAIDIDEIVYTAEDWPTTLLGASYQRIHDYFKEGEYET